MTFAPKDTESTYVSGRIGGRYFGLWPVLRMADHEELLARAQDLLRAAKYGMGEAQIELPEAIRPAFDEFAEAVARARAERMR